jgi:aryl-alcohol dehydrogenase-like predicted oxidoreductase
MGMSQSYGPADGKESIETLYRAIELGCNFFDTAEGYGPYTNEELLGRALKSRRDKIILATKFGFRFACAGQTLHLFFSAGKESYQHCLFSKVGWVKAKRCPPIKASQESFLPLPPLFDVASFCSYV